MTIAECGIRSESVQVLCASVRGEMIEPGDEAYDEARRVYDAMIDRAPGRFV